LRRTAAAVSACAACGPNNAVSTTSNCMPATVAGLRAGRNAGGGGAQWSELSQPSRVCRQWQVRSASAGSDEMGSLQAMASTASTANKSSKLDRNRSVSAGKKPKGRGGDVRPTLPRSHTVASSEPRARAATAGSSQAPRATTVAICQATTPSRRRVAFWLRPVSRKRHVTAQAHRRQGRVAGLAFRARGRDLPKPGAWPNLLAGTHTDIHDSKHAVGSGRHTAGLPGARPTATGNRRHG